MIVYNYVFIGMLLVAAIVFAVMPIVAMRVLSPRKPSANKRTPFECGVVTVGETWMRFRTQYYLYALLFVVFDVEVVFLYPWAAAYGGLGVFALVEMAVFLTILASGLVYAWAKGVLKWT